MIATSGSILPTGVGCSDPEGGTHKGQERLYTWMDNLSSEGGEASAREGRVPQVGNVTG